MDDSSVFLRFEYLFHLKNKVEGKVFSSRPCGVEELIGNI